MSGSATTWSRTVFTSGRGAAQRRLGGLGHDAPRLVPDATGLVGGQTAALDQGPLEVVDRVVRQLPLDLLRDPVLALGVGRRVRVGPGHTGVDQRRTDAGPDLAHHLAGRPSDREVVGAVDRPHLQPGEAPHQLVDRRRGLLRRRHRDGVAVVGHHEQHGQVLHARGVEALPELALRRGALAQADVGDLVAVGREAQLGAAHDVAPGLGAAHRRDALAAGRARLGDDVERLVAPVGRHLAAARRRVVGRLRPPGAAPARG